MQKMLPSSPPAAFAAGLAAATLAAGVLYALQARRAAAAPAASADASAMSTTSSAQGTDVYETSKAVAEYLLFHFGAPQEILPYAPALGHHGALDFAARTGRLCAEWARRQGLALDAAFDVGCAVGGTSFELSRDFERVVGLDFSHAFVAAAERLRGQGAERYTYQVEGAITGQGEARLPSGARPERCTFMQGDACALPSAEALGGRFTVIHGANLLCRLPDPMCVAGGGRAAPQRAGVYSSAPATASHAHSLSLSPCAPLSRPPPPPARQALHCPPGLAAGARGPGGARVALLLAAAVHQARAVAGRARQGGRLARRLPAGPAARHAGQRR